MRVKLTLRRPGAPLTDIVVMADSTATVANITRQIATTDPLRSTAARQGDTLSLSVAAPTSEGLETLNPDLLIGDAPIGSGFLARDHQPRPEPGIRRSQRCQARRVAHGHLGPGRRQRIPPAGGALLHRA